MRLRILLGTLLLLVGLAVYGIVVAAVVSRYLGDKPLIEIAIFAVAGIIWIFPAARLTLWMQQSPAHRPPFPGDR